MRHGDDPDSWDWTAPQPPPVAQPMPEPEPERSPYAPSTATKLAVIVTSLLIFGGGLVYLFRYELGLRHGHYAFMAVQPGTDVPVTYQVCRPITYLVDDTNEVQGGQRMIDEAVAEVSRRTGLQFVSMGTTSHEQGSGRVVLRIAWSDEQQVPQLAGDTVGIGGSSSVLMPSGRRYFDSGEISLDAPDLARTLVETGPASVRAVIMHELAHVVGLDHVSDRNELMYQNNLGKTDFGPGDLEGLTLLGQGGCETTRRAQDSG